MIAQDTITGQIGGLTSGWVALPSGMRLNLANVLYVTESATETDCLFVVANGPAAGGFVLSRRDSAALRQVLDGGTA